MPAERLSRWLIISFVFGLLMLAIPAQATQFEGIVIPPPGILRIPHAVSGLAEPDMYTVVMVEGSLIEYFNDWHRLPTADEMGVILSREPIGKLVNGEPVRVWSRRSSGISKVPQRAGDVAYKLSPCGHRCWITYYNDAGQPSLTVETNY